MKIDKIELLKHMKNKKESFENEHKICSDELRKEKVFGEFKILEWYIEQIEKGTFDVLVIKEKRKANIGDEIKIISNTCHHDFEIGQIVKVVPWQEFNEEDEYNKNGVEAASLIGGQHWFVVCDDYVVIER